MHRTLNLTKMVSIEKATHDKLRFEANLPFSCIEMLWGDTASELPKVDFSQRSIVWLDYDGRLTKSVLADIREVASRAVGGTVLAVTVQCRYDRVGTDGDDRSLVYISDMLGAERVPLGMMPKDLRGDGTGKLFRSIIAGELLQTLNDRNAGRHHTQKMRFKQILNFGYEDGVRMMTVAFVIYDAGQEANLSHCSFDELPFYRENEDIFEICIPKLTTREVAFLEGLMPGELTAANIGQIPKRDAEHFASIYRYFPNVTFVDG
jgi:hypothetical protein